MWVNFSFLLEEAILLLARLWHVENRRPSIRAANRRSRTMDRRERPVPRNGSGMR